MIEKACKHARTRTATPGRQQQQRSRGSNNSKQRQQAAAGSSSTAGKYSILLLFAAASYRRSSSRTLTVFGSIPYYNQRYCIIIGKMGDPIAIHSKPVVAVDIDEVLAQFIPSLATFHNEVYGGTALTSESFVSYEFHHVWGGTKEECSHKVSVYCAISLFCFFMYPLFRWINSSCPPIFEKMSHQCQKRLRIWLS